MKVTIESSFLLIYPIYNAIFLRVHNDFQVAFVLVLPAIKAMLKKIVATASAENEDQTPLLMASVDLFNAFYQSKRMQSSESIWTTVGIISIDALQNLYSLRKLFSRTAAFRELSGDSLDSTQLLANVLHLCEDPKQLDLETFLRLRVISTSTIAMPETKTAIITRLSQVQSHGRQRRSSVSESRDKSSRRHSSTASALQPNGTDFASVAPWPLVAATDNHQTPTAPDFPELSNNKMKAKVLKMALEFLWKCELVLLVEYIESAIPFVYAIYLAILYHLPNAKYYPGVESMTPEDLKSSVSGILVYALLETALAVGHARNPQTQIQSLDAASTGVCA